MIAHAQDSKAGWLVALSLLACAGCDDQETAPDLQESWRAALRRDFVSQDGPFLVNPEAVAHDPGRCELHGVRMRQGGVPVLFGYVPPEAIPSQADAPNANRFVLGGCRGAGASTFAVVPFCPECRARVESQPLLRNK